MDFIMLMILRICLKLGWKRECECVDEAEEEEIDDIERYLSGLYRSVSALSRLSKAV